jgi:cytochrome c peroxidase
MKPAHKLKYGTAIIVLGMLAAFPPGVTEVMAQVGPKKANPGQNKKQLIERGRELFMNETFNGNGRTCATCHPPTNNFTIDPAFIATLPPTDPLFVAEFNPALADLENPDLMRNFGLILENLDGLPPQDPVFRGVPHTLALPTSLEVDPDGAPNQTRDDPAQSTVVQATGWSADGAPGDGSLHSFATGAVTQHFPKTLNRIPGQDFRLPTQAELDAMAAFQLSLGRQTDLNLGEMTFLDDDVDTGKDLFIDGVDGPDLDDAPTCSGCHRNAGATDFTGFNGNIQTNVAMLVTPAREFARANGGDLPGDGGFDAVPEFDESVDGLDVTYRGNKTMNVPPLVEAADTGPFFHNNAVDTIEEAAAFYTTDTFSTDPSRQFVLNPSQINQIGAFLRAINALENIRSSDAYSEQAQREVQKLARQTVKIVVAETEDAVQVLTEGKPSQTLLPLYPEAVALLEEALDLEIQADQTTPPPQRNALLRQAAALKNEARDLILE